MTWGHHPQKECGTPVSLAGFLSGDAVSALHARPPSALGPSPQTAGRQTAQLTSLLYKVGLSQVFHFSNRNRPPARQTPDTAPASTSLQSQVDAQTTRSASSKSTEHSDWKQRAGSVPRPPAAQRCCCFHLPNAHPGRQQPSQPAGSLAPTWEPIELWAPAPGWPSSGCCRHLGRNWQTDLPLRVCLNKNFRKQSSCL